MKFNCYDVLEVQGKRYVVGEVISYQEFIVDKTIRYDLNDENYKKELGVSKGAQSWTEYGLMPVDGEDKKWLTIVNGEKDYCTFSETILRSTPPKGYKLYDKGLQRVISVKGESKARSGDKADYKEYRSIKKDKTNVFFIEDWHGGLTDQAQGERIRLSDVHRRRDQAAQAASKKIRNAARRKEWTRLGLSWGIILFFLGYLFIGDMSWHELRDEVGFDAVYGKVYNIKQDTKSPEQWIVIYTTKDVSVISVVNGTTYVEVGQLKNLSDSENTRIATIRNDSEILLRYAYMVELKNKQGRKTLSNIIKD